MSIISFRCCRRAEEVSPPVPSNRSAAADLAIGINRLRARRNRKWTRYGDEALPAWIADMDFKTASEILAALERLVAEEDFGYPDRDGDDPARAIAAAFARHELDVHGWRLDPELVRPLPDLIQATFTTVIAFTEPGDGVILPVPAYPPFRTAIEGSGRHLLESPMSVVGGRWCVDLENLRALSHHARMLMVCNPHNPTGRVLGRAELAPLADIARGEDLVLVSDEVHSELVYPGQSHIPMALMSSDIAAVTITSATKSFNIAGLRCVVLHFGSSQLYDRFRSRFSDQALGAVNVFGVDATLAAWAKGGLGSSGCYRYSPQIVCGLATSSERDSRRRLYPSGSDVLCVARLGRAWVKSITVGRPS